MLWPLPSNADASFFVGCELEQLAIGDHLVTFRFRDADGNPVKLDVEEGFDLLTGEASYRWRPRDLATAGAAVAAVVGQQVVAANTQDSRLELRFANGARLVVLATASEVESYQVVRGKGYWVV